MVVYHCGNNFHKIYIFEKRKSKSTSFFYFFSSPSGLFKVISISPLWTVTSVPRFRASITVYKTANAKISPTPLNTDGSICPVGGMRKLDTNNPVLIPRHTQKAILLDFVNLKNFDILSFILRISSFRNK